MKAYKLFKKPNRHMAHSQPQFFFLGGGWCKEQILGDSWLRYYAYRKTIAVKNGTC